MTNRQTYDELQEVLSPSGLRILHSGPAGHAPFDQQGDASVLIIGHAGSEFWRHFQRSAEFSDGAPDPLDRWSRRVICAAAPAMRFVSPNDGPPYAPIHALTRGGALHPSPLGMLAHVEFGLWVAVRGLLVSAQDLPMSAPFPAPNHDVFAKCFEACPVSAFTETCYDAAACADFLIRNESAPCWRGCLARKACTLGQDWAYHDSHAKFYMDAFTQSMKRRMA